MSDRDKDAEIPAPRHPLAVLQRQLGSVHVRFTPANRAFPAAPLHPLPRAAIRRLRLLVHPDTVLGRHRGPMRPHAAWVIQAARNLAMDLKDAGANFRHLIQDRDAKFPDLFDQILAEADIQVVLSRVRIPCMNSITERRVRICRHELLDRTLLQPCRFGCGDEASLSGSCRVAAVPDLGPGQ